MMKKTLILFWTILLLSSPPSFAQISDSDAIQAEVIKTQGSPCFDRYQKFRNRMAVASGLAPVVGLAGVVGSAVAAFSYEYGALSVLRGGVLGPATDVFFSHVLPIAALGTLVGLETYTITKYIMANHAYRLMTDLYGIGDGTTFSQFVKKVQKKRPDLSEEKIKTLLLEADQKRDLCNGNWSSRYHQNHGGINPTLALLPQMRAHIIESR